jgi:hypothetical protein
VKGKIEKQGHMVLVLVELGKDDAIALVAGGYALA